MNIYIYHTEEVKIHAGYTNFAAVKGEKSMQPTMGRLILKSSYMYIRRTKKIKIYNSFPPAPDIQSHLF